MILDPRDGNLFFKLFLPLLSFVNSKYDISPALEHMEPGHTAGQSELKEAADKLWEHTELIDEYLATRHFTKEESELILSWKRRKTGQFVLERHLKKGSIFIDMSNSDCYQVLGLLSSFEELFIFARLPVLIYATLLPFRDVIVSDGLLQMTNLIMGRNIAKSFKEVYMGAKREGRIIRSL